MTMHAADMPIVVSMQTPRRKLPVAAGDFSAWPACFDTKNAAMTKAELRDTVMSSS